MFYLSLIRNFPFYLFLGVWIAVFLMYSYSPYPFHSINENTVNLMVVGFVCVILGIIVARVYWLKGNIELYNENANYGLIFNEQKLQKLILVLSILVFIGSFLILYIFSEERGGIVSYLSNPIRARQVVVGYVGISATGWNKILSLSNYFVDFNYFTSLLGGILFTQKKIKKKYVILPLITAVIVSIFTFQRYFLVFNFALWFFTIITISNHLNSNLIKIISKRILKMGLVILILFLIFSVALISVRVSFGKFNIDNMKIIELAIESNYSYVVSPTICFDKFYHSNNLFHNGDSIFRHVFKWFTRLNLWNEDDVFPSPYEFRKTGVGMGNTYTYLRVFYEDFGLSGIIFLSFIWGFIGNFLYNTIKQNFSFVRLYIATVFLFSFFMSFYDFGLINLTLHILMIFIIYIFENMLSSPQNYYKINRLE